MVKSPKQIERIRHSGKILGKVLKALSLKAIPGATLKELDELAEGMILQNDAKPVFKGYKPYGARSPYPSTICASINDVVVHGVPTRYKLQSGDVLKVDVGVNWQGGISDAAITIPIGSVSNKIMNLIKTTELALEHGIKAVKAGNTLGDVGYAIESVIKKKGFCVVDGLTGHGVGTELHEEPVIYNFGQPGRGLKLKEGMVLAIEPMTSMGSHSIVQLKDDSYATADGSVSAHFEHTVLVKKDGAEVLTA